MNTFISVKITVGESEIEGRGVLALDSIALGEIVEVSPVVVYRCSERQPYEWDSENILMVKYHGFGSWFDHDDLSIMATGFAPFYNHSDEPNIEIVKNYTDLTMSFIAIKDVKKGEELCINYNVRC